MHISLCSPCATFVLHALPFNALTLMSMHMIHIYMWPHTYLCIRSIPPFNIHLKRMTLSYPTPNYNSSIHSYEAHPILSSDILSHLSQ